MARMLDKIGRRILGGKQVIQSRKRIEGAGRVIDTPKAASAEAAVARPSQKDTGDRARRRAAQVRRGPSAAEIARIRAKRRQK